MIYRLYLLLRNCSGERIYLGLCLFLFSFKFYCNQVLNLHLRHERFLGRTIYFQNYAEFFVSFVDVFLERQNDFSADCANPLIVDAGANLGFTTLYLKRKYPEARVIIFEPDPVNLHDIQNNIANLSGCKIIPKALSDQSDSVTFYRDSRDFTGGSLRKNQANDQALRVSAVCLKDEITEDIDYLKLDIEGMESAVVNNLASSFPHKIKNIFLEFHWNNAMPDNRLSDILRFFEKFNYEYIMESRMRSPFRRLQTPYGFNIFAYLR